MPKTRVVLFQDEDGSVPLLAWLESLPEKAQDKCVVRIERLGERGHELRRPEADFLRDEIHELRAKHSGVSYRVLYFFHERDTVVLSHGFSKQQAKVPRKEIELAIKRKKCFLESPKNHTHEGP